MSQCGIWSDALENWMSFDDRGKLFVASLPIARAQLRCVAEDMEERLQLQVRPFDTESATVYGIWMPKNDNRLGGWFILGDSQVFHTIYRAVAEAQLQYVKRNCSDHYPVIEVREFPVPTD